MRECNSHLSDQELVVAADGELSRERARHLAGCQACQSRQRELADAVELVRERGPALPSAGAARVRLRVSLAELAAPSSPPPFWSRPWLRARPWLPAVAGAAALVCAVAVLGLYQWPQAHAFDVPKPHLTPGAARSVDRAAVCNSALPKNQVVPADLRERVFRAYGIANDNPGKYELDYLITPALGGADDIRNLWPQPYVSATVWNARVKDELEDRLRDLVCGGRLDLAEAQREIATDWIAAYQKYFHTKRPARKSGD